nr:MAG: GIY-YIG catalytic domain protein [Bacteriophage sp.]
MEYINEFSGECGTYYIQNKINNHLYIGSSITLTKRYKEHKLKLSTNAICHLQGKLFENYALYI